MEIGDIKSAVSGANTVSFLTVTHYTTNSAKVKKNFYPPRKILP